MRTLFLMAVILGVGAFVALAQDDEKKAAIGKLKGVKTSVNFNNTPLGAAIDQVREAGGGLNIHIADHIRDQFSGENAKTVTLKLNGVSLYTVLKMTLGDSYMAVYQQGTILITTSDKVPQMMATVIYDVHDLLFVPLDFPGPRVDLLPPDTYTERYGNKGGSPIGGIWNFPSQPPPVDTNFIVQMIRESTGGDSNWSGSAFIEEKNGMLWVRHTKGVQDEVVRLLGQIRQFQR